MVADCEAVYTNMFHAGPLGVNGGQLEPFPEGEVFRSTDVDWDWLTWNGHAVAAEPDDAQRREWYGLPRQARVTRIGPEPRTGGQEWRMGKDYTIEQVTEPDPLEGATRIHWIQTPPTPGVVYYVTFEQPKEYGCMTFNGDMSKDAFSEKRTKRTALVSFTGSKIKGLAC